MRRFIGEVKRKEWFRELQRTVRSGKADETTKLIYDLHPAAHPVGAKERRDLLARAQKEPKLRTRLFGIAEDNTLSPGVRAAAVHTLCAAEADGILPLCIRLIEERDDPIVMTAAVFCLGRLRDPEALAALLSFLADPQKLADEPCHKLVLTAAFTVLQEAGGSEGASTLRRYAQVRCLPKSVRNLARDLLSTRPASNPEQMERSRSD